MSCEKIELIKSQKVLAELNYEPIAVSKGYTDKTLYINVSDNSIKIKDVPEHVRKNFIGGKGYGLYSLWNAIKDNTNWFNPENEIVIASGPIAGIVQYPGSGKSIVVSLSPLSNNVMDSNVGGHFGPYLKFSGFDAIELQGKTENDVVIYINGNTNTIKIYEANYEFTDSHIYSQELTEAFAENEEDKRNISVVSTGSAAKHTHIGLINVSFYDKRRKEQRLKQAGRGGLGTVFANKGIRAVVVHFSGTSADTNNSVDLKTIQQTGIKLHKEIHDLDAIQAQKREVGTANIVEIMNDYDLLPCYNFKYGSNPETIKIDSKNIKKIVTQEVPDGCWFGCSLACAKAADCFLLKTGPYKGQKVLIDGPEYETVSAVGSNPGVFNMNHVFECNFYCDTYGVDTISFGTLTAFLMECYDLGILNKERTGGLELCFGNGDAMLELLHQMSSGTGFGLIAGCGVEYCKKYFVENFGADEAIVNDIGMVGKGLEVSQYMSKESIAQQAGYFITNKGPQHDEAWLIFMDMVNNQIPTYEDKAEALHYFPMFRTWFGLLGLCKLPWNDIEPANNRQTAEPAKVPEHVDNYLALYKSVTGIEINRDDMIRMSEKVYNFQRVFVARRGYASRKHDTPPYRAVGPVTREEYISRASRYDKQLAELGVDINGKTVEEKLNILRKQREKTYQELLSVVYKRRGWDENGIPKIEFLKEIGMDYPEVLEVVERINKIW